MMKRLLAFALAAGMFICAGDMYAQCSKSCGKDKSACGASKKQEQEKPAISQLKTVTRDEVAAMVKAGSVTVIDARDEKSFADGHIDGAINFGKADLPADRNATLVFYCGGTKCPLAKRAALRASKHGYSNVMVYSGGWAEWSAGQEQI